jgi:hypothetical protein
MTPAVLHRLRLRSRRVAAATVAVFALNWLGLALAPCAMAFALPGATHATAVPAVAPAGADSTVAAHPPGCPGHSGAATVAPAFTPEARSVDAHPCPWCPDAGATGGSHDAECAATPKPALDGRDAKNPVTPLLVALSATVLGVVPVAASAGGWPAAEPAPPPDAPAADRYCRRLE